MRIWAWDGCIRRRSLGAGALMIDDVDVDVETYVDLHLNYRIFCYLFRIVFLARNQ